MRLTIVTLSLNQVRYLQECLDAVLSQRISDLEYIVVDPGSTDGSRHLLRNYEPRLADLILEPDQGPGDGLNKALGRSTGEVCGYINADDYYLPGALAAVQETFARCPAADVVYGDGVLVGACGDSRRRLVSDPWSLNAYVRGAGTVVQQATFFRRSAFEKTGGFNVANRTCWDGELLIRLAQSGAHFHHLCRQLGAFRVHKDSITGSGRLSSEYLRDRQRLFQDVFGAGPDAGDRLAGFLLRLVFWVHRRVLHSAAGCRAGGRVGAVR